MNVIKHNLEEKSIFLLLEHKNILENDEIFNFFLFLKVSVNPLKHCHGPRGSADPTLETTDIYYTCIEADTTRQRIEGRQLPSYSLSFSHMKTFTNRTNKFYR